MVLLFLVSYLFIFICFTLREHNAGQDVPGLTISKRDIDFGGCF